MELTNDQVVQELIELLNKNQQKEAANNVGEMAAYIQGMERKMDAVIEELAGMRKQLAEMEVKRQRKSLKEALTKTIDNLEQQCQKIKQQLFEVKTEFKEKAAEIVAEAKQKGKAALNKVSEFTGIRDKLEKIRQDVKESITEVDRSLDRIDALGKGMREAFQKAANTLRVFAGKPEKKYGEKKFSKTELLKQPLMAKRKLLSGVMNYAEAALNQIQRLTQDQQQQRDQAVQKMERVETEVINPSANMTVAEPAFQYGAEVFEAYEQQITQAMTEKMAKQNVPVMSGKSR